MQAAYFEGEVLFVLPPTLSLRPANAPSDADGAHLCVRALTPVGWYIGADGNPRNSIPRAVVMAGDRAAYGTDYIGTRDVTGASRPDPAAAITVQIPAPAIRKRPQSLARR